MEAIALFLTWLSHVIQIAVFMINGLSAKSASILLYFFDMTLPAILRSEWHYMF